MEQQVIVHDEAATPEAKARRSGLEKALRMPRGIVMNEYATSYGVLFVGQYVNRRDLREQVNPKRVYQIRVERDKTSPAAFTAKIKEDDTVLFILKGLSKWVVAEAALGALRGLLEKRVRQSSHEKRKRRRARGLKIES